MRVSPSFRPGARRQRGAIAVVVAFSLVALVLMLGLVLDIGHLYVTKAELQNAADSCALSAAAELNDLGTGALDRSTAAGITAGNRNRIDLQGVELRASGEGIVPADVTFSDTLDGVYSRAVTSTTVYARCAPRETNVKSVVLWFVGVVLYLFFATALGIFLGTISRSMAQFALLIILVIVVLMLLSGGSTPVESQPRWLQAVTFLLPARHFVSFSQVIIYRGGGLRAVWLQFLMVAAVGLFVEDDHHIVGKTRMPRHPTRFRGTPAELTNHSPGLGEHTDEILTELGRADDIAQLRESGAVA